jgi:hypothetical protein
MHYPFRAMMTHTVPRDHGIGGGGTQRCLAVVFAVTGEPPLHLEWAESKDGLLVVYVLSAVVMLSTLVLLTVLTMAHCAHYEGSWCSLWSFVSFPVQKPVSRPSPPKDWMLIRTLLLVHKISHVLPGRFGW